MAINSDHPSDTRTTRPAVANLHSESRTHVRLGYACINLTLGPKARTSRTCRLRNVTKLRLEELARANLAGLWEILRWNASHEIKVFRISSGIIPLASHRSAKWPWRQKLQQEISRLGRFATEHEMRLSMHPGQYTVLNSPHKEVVSASKAELSYHTNYLDAMELSSEHKIILHVGGVYGNRDGSLLRFRQNFQALPANVKSRLALENDERCYGIYDVLDLCEALKIPMVFDYLHHQAFGGGTLRNELLDRIYATWSPSDCPPEMHYSTQRRRSRKGAHAHMIHPEDFAGFLKILPKRNVDVILEAKSKDKALLSLRGSLHRRNLPGVIVE